LFLSLEIEIIMMVDEDVDELVQDVVVYDTEY